MQKIAGGFEPVGKRPALMSDAKLRVLHGIVTDGDLRRENVVVWFRFNHEIDEAHRYLKSKRVAVDYIHGAKPGGKPIRSKLQDRFQRGKIRVLLMQEALGQFGWDLSRANTAIYYSNSYEFEDRRQSEDRIIHPLKKTPVQYIDLETEDSIDEDVVDSLRAKDRTSRVFTRDIAARVAKQLARFSALSRGSAL
jgi:SNF2 family DNA or RNA helicase